MFFEVYYSDQYKCRVCVWDLAEVHDNLRWVVTDMMKRCDMIILCNTKSISGGESEKVLLSMRNSQYRGGWGFYDMESAFHDDAHERIGVDDLCICKDDTCERISGMFEEVKTAWSSVREVWNELRFIPLQFRMIRGRDLVWSPGLVQVGGREYDMGESCVLGDWYLEKYVHNNNTGVIYRQI
jgi:hypothetical protein